jgi:microcystin-dependent protein
MLDNPKLKGVRGMENARKAREYIERMVRPVFMRWPAVALILLIVAVVVAVALRGALGTKGKPEAKLERGGVAPVGSTTAHEGGGEALFIDKDGNVSIGTTEHDCRLTVAGTVKAEKFEGQVTHGVPPGTILPFGGVGELDDPVGYIPCDSRPVNREKYADLFATIGTAWGVGDGSTTFNVPDLRGYFLRGTDAGAGRDPDAAGRTAIGEEIGTGGNTGDNVGSIQSDQFGEHTHTGPGEHVHVWRGWRRVASVAAGKKNVRSKEWIATDPEDWSKDPSGTHNHGPQGGNETRPKNAYVNYIIKY